jgi:hypothetical protein
MDVMGSDQSGFPETEVGRVTSSFCPDNDVVDQRNLQKSTNLGKTTGKSTVGFTRLGITRRVVMGNGYRIRTECDRRPENLAGMGDAFIETTSRDLPVIK